MSDCEICGKPAGLFRSVHKECVEKRDRALADIDLAFVNVMRVENPPSPPIFRAIIEKLGGDAHLNPAGIRARVMSGLGVALNAALEDFDLSQNELERLNHIVDAFGLDLHAFDEAGIKDRLVKALVLKDLSEGRPSTRVTGTNLSVVLKRDEALQWYFNGVTLHETRTKTSYVGGSQGISVRLIKGVSCRVGAYKGQRVQTSELVAIGEGDLAVTTTAVYFAGSVASKKVPLSSIVSVNAYSDGIMVAPSRGKPQVYLLDDPMFAANLILKAAAL